MRLWIFTIVIVVLFGALAWSNDFVTLQGERTVYTVECQGGPWQGTRCGGHLVAGDRFRFRALKTHREVVFWRVGVAEASAKFADCVIADGRNWKCQPNADAARSITLEMLHGTPVPDAAGRTRTFHAVAKWRWLLLRAGVYAGNDADG